MCSRWANVSLSAITPQCCFGKISCESCCTVAGPSATDAVCDELHPLLVVLLDRLDPPGHVVERMAVRGEAELHAVERGHEVEGLDVRLQRVGAVARRPRRAA